MARPSLHLQPQLSAVLDRKEKNQLKSATGFFNHVRTPATFLAKFGMASLWFWCYGKDHMRMYQSTFTLLITLSVGLEVGAILTATAANVKLLNSHDFNPMAVDTKAFLVREMELEYLAVRLEFFMGLLALIGAVAVRLWATLHKAHLNLAKGLVCMFFAMIVNSIIYYHSSCAPYWNLPHMMVRLVVLSLKRFKRYPLTMAIAVATGFGAAYFSLVAVWNDFNHLLGSAPTPDELHAYVDQFLGYVDQFVAYLKQRFAADSGTQQSVPE